MDAAAELQHTLQLCNHHHNHSTRRCPHRALFAHPTFACPPYSSKVTCCNEDDYGYGGYDKKGLFLEKKVYSPAIGSCDFQNTLFSTPISIVPSVTNKVGTSTIICTFYDGSEKCDSELCDSLSFTAEVRGQCHQMPGLCTLHACQACSPADVNLVSLMKGVPRVR